MESPWCFLDRSVFDDACTISFDAMDHLIQPSPRSTHPRRRSHRHSAFPLTFHNDTLIHTLILTLLTPQPFCAPHPDRPPVLAWKGRMLPFVIGAVFVFQGVLSTNGACCRIGERLTEWDLDPVAR
jgi:hypothetical protein